ncbi:MAG: AraC family transcriptional regulator [Bacteroidetes bacterium]|nr:MAG: AraC family transcriptional regulator [Bacteroidota bacterium]
MEIILWVGLSQSLFAAILIGTKKENSVSDKILTGWLSLLGIEFFTCIMDHLIFGKPLLSNSFLLFNPAFYLYIKSLTRPEFKLKWVQLLHLVPFLTFEVVGVVVPERASLVPLFEYSSNFIFNIFFIPVSLASWIGYNLASILLVHRFRKNLQNELSSISRENDLAWLLFLIVFYVTFCVSAYGLGLYSVLSERLLQMPFLFNYAVLLLLIYILSYYGLIQKNIFHISDVVPKVTEKYQGSFLSSSKKKEIRTAILSFFDNEKPFLNPDLNLQVLSESLDYPKHHLTEVLNTAIGKNFFQFVNAYRVEAVKAALSKKDNLYSIEAIGYDCGFSSKSSFFTVFKKMTGMTPLQYRQSQI